MENPEKLAQ